MYLYEQSRKHPYQIYWLLGTKKIKLHISIEVEDVSYNTDFIFIELEVWGIAGPFF